MRKLLHICDRCGKQTNPKHMIAVSLKSTHPMGVAVTYADPETHEPASVLRETEEDRPAVEYDMCGACAQTKPVIVDLTMVTK